MLAALADAGAVLGRQDYLTAAGACADFILSKLRDERGRLLRTYKEGRAGLNAYLEDHAFLIEALLVLYEATFETRWFTRARELADNMIDRYADTGEAGGFYTTSDDHESLVVRLKDFEDHPIPSGNSSAAFALLRLAAFTGEREYERHALQVFRIVHQAAWHHPQAFGHLLQAMHFHFSPRREVALVGNSLGPLAAVVRTAFRPSLVLAGMAPGDEEAARAVPLLQGRTAVNGRAAAYVCERFTCSLPVTEPEELERELETDPG
jgi:uncharacterized protein YyaL (SSP411 family)